MPAFTPQLPCPGGTLRVRHVYSECRDGKWHVVEDDYYSCPPDGAARSFRTMEIDTGRDCKAGDPPHKPTASIPDLHGDTSCTSPVKIGEVVITECVNNSWEHATYDLYECADKSLRIAVPATSIARTDVPCSSPLPRPSGA